MTLSFLIGIGYRSTPNRRSPMAMHANNPTAW